MSLDRLLLENGWGITWTQTIPGRSGGHCSATSLSLQSPTNRFLAAKYPLLYEHQHAAISAYIEGIDVCITTGTASGKSLPFFVAGLEALQSSSEARVLVIYPLRALGREQEQRWKDAITEAGLNVQIGRIDGQTDSARRLSILRECRVLIMTPDIIHTWLLSKVSETQTLKLLRNLKLIILDEAHSYSGVFGSNSAFLFRRLQQLMFILGSSPQYICASATIANAGEHLRKLLGRQFVLVEKDKDTSPRHPTNIFLTTPPSFSDILTEISHLIVSLVHTKHRFLAFVDSRKQVEHVSSIVNRNLDKLDNAESTRDLDHLNVLPFRSGYEQADRNTIQDRLNAGLLNGVISTSALELGIDIPHLDTGVLIGVPRSSTSLYQRMGRIGRHKQGNIIIVNTGTVYDEAVFREPHNILRRPPAEGALYLQNARIQYIHALCLSRSGGEQDRALNVLGIKNPGYSPSIDWPSGFLELCENERTGEIPIDLQSMKAESGDDPNHTFPLRDAETQYKVELKQGPEQRSMGSLSGGQVMRESYPGAIYYYATQPLRVYKVNQSTKTVFVRSEKHYTTKPNTLPVSVYPNLTPGNIHRSFMLGSLLIIECNLQIRESVSGYKERRGSNEVSVSYPTDYLKTGINFESSRFARNYFSTGVIITHPSFNVATNARDLLSELIYESFLMTVPYERQDINFSTDRHRASRGQIKDGDVFVSIYDQTYGSLRLSRNLCDIEIFSKTIQNCLNLAKNLDPPCNDTCKIIEEIASCLREPMQALSFMETRGPQANENICRQRIILPGSSGWNLKRSNEEFMIDRIQYHPSIGGMAYRGRHRSILDSNVLEFLELTSIIEIPGESKIGWYDYDTGDILEESE